MEYQPQHYRREHAEQNMDKRQTAGTFTFALRKTTKVDPDQAKQTTPEHDHHGQNRTQLNDHFEGFCGIAFKAQQMANDNHMAGTGNR